MGSTLAENRPRDAESFGLCLSTDTFALVTDVSNSSLERKINLTKGSVGRGIGNIITCPCHTHVKRTLLLETLLVLASAKTSPYLGPYSLHVLSLTSTSASADR